MSTPWEAQAAVTELLKAKGATDETAGGVARMICNLDEQDLLAALNGRKDLTGDGEALPPAVSALKADPPEQPSFAINGFLMASEIHLLVSDGGVGKTTLALAIAASVASGRELFECEAFKVNTPGSVLIVSEPVGEGSQGVRAEPSSCPSSRRSAPRSSFRWADPFPPCVRCCVRSHSKWCSLTI